jgi:hypothetical protein
MSVILGPIIGEVTDTAARVLFETNVSCVLTVLLDTGGAGLALPLQGGCPSESRVWV